jgi:hypothetical protein
VKQLFLMSLFVCSAMHAASSSAAASMVKSAVVLDEATIAGCDRWQQLLVGLAVDDHVKAVMAYAMYTAEKTMTPAVLAELTSQLRQRAATREVAQHKQTKQNMTPSFESIH